MKPIELNQKLISAFPELTEAYHEQVDWQEGDDTGSHVVYGDVLFPVMRAYLEGECYSIVQKYFDFLEALLVTGDDYATDIITTTVIESLFFDTLDATRVRPLLGKKTRGIWDNYLGLTHRYSSGGQQ